MTSRTLFRITTRLLLPIAISVIVHSISWGSVTPTPGGLGRVRLWLEIQGSTLWKGAGAEWSESQVHDTYHVEALLKAGIPHSLNMLDPESAREHQQHAEAVQAHHARVRQRADEAAQRQPRPTQALFDPTKLDMNQLMALQQKIASCGADEACKQRIGMEFVAQQASQGPHPEVGKQLQQITDYCVHKLGHKPGSGGYEQCLEAEGRKRSTRPADPRDDETVEAPPDRYLPYWSHVDEFHCTLTGKTTIDRRSKGELADVQGMVPVRSSLVGAGSADPQATCNFPAVEVDLTQHKLWVQSFPIISANIESVETQGLQRSTGKHLESGFFIGSNYQGRSTKQSFSDWLIASLSAAPYSGSRTETFVSTDPGGQTAGGTQTGSLTAKLRWEFVTE